MAQRKRQAGAARRSSNGHSRKRAFKSTHRPTELDFAVQQGYEKVKRGCAQCAEVAADLFTDFPGVARKVFKNVHKALNAPPPKPGRSWVNSRTR